VKYIEKRHFTLNGVEERILKRPESRQDTIKFTFGGMAEHAVEMPLVDFEKETGLILKGLEPELSFHPDAVIESLKRKMHNREMVVEGKDKYSLISGTIKYTNNKNTEFAATLYVAERSNDKYVVRVAKKGVGSHMNTWEFEANSKTLPHAAEQAIEKLDSFLKLKVQVLSADNDTSEYEERHFSEEGLPILWRNESLSDYFKSQDKLAGVVINSNGKYQYFHSYEVHGGEQHLHYDTKDYKTLNGCKKKMQQLGFDIHGRQLDIFPTQEMRLEFEEQIRDSNMRNHFSPQWNDDVLAEVNMDNVANVVFSGINKVDHPQFGYQYHTEVTVTSLSTGEKATHQLPIDAREGGNPYSVSCKMTNFLLETRQQILAGEFEFEEDHRTLGEKIDFHREQLSDVQRRLDFDNERRKTVVYHNEHQRKIAQDRNDEFKAKVSLHKSALKELGNEMKLVKNRVDNSNDMDLGM